MSKNLKLLDWVKSFSDFDEKSGFFSLCIVGELASVAAGEGSVAVAVGLSDRRHATHDK